MHFHDEIPIELSHLLEGDISQNTSVVNDNINSAEGIDSGFDDFLSKFNRIVVGYC
jgi:hypothetical protein